MSKFKTAAYELIKRDGKFGLACDGRLVLEPVYDFLMATNSDTPLPDLVLSRYEEDPNVHTITEWNCQIVIANEKLGLMQSGELVSQLIYDQIIKLTFCHYLCRKQKTWTLYHHYNTSEQLATFEIPGHVTLTTMLQALAKHRRAYAHLSERLYRQADRYISEYRYYNGTEIFGTIVHDFVLQDKMVMHNDFHVTPVSEYFQ